MDSFLRNDPIGLQKDISHHVMYTLADLGSASMTLKLIRFKSRGEREREFHFKGFLCQLNFETKSF